MHLGRTEPDAAFPLKNALIADATDEAIQMYRRSRGIEKAALEAAMRGIIGALEHAFDARQITPWKAFDLCYAVERSSPQHPGTRRQPERRDLRRRTQN